VGAYPKDNGKKEKRKKAAPLANGKRGQNSPEFEAGEGVKKK